MTLIAQMGSNSLVMQQKQQDLSTQQNLLLWQQM